jgi:Protein of unknown function (DUF2510)
MTSSETPAGWYDGGQRSLRWWNGAEWTEHTQPTSPAQAAPLAAAKLTVQCLSFERGKLSTRAQQISTHQISTSTPPRR